MKFVLKQLLPFIVLFLAYSCTKFENAVDDPRFNLQTESMLRDYTNSVYRNLFEGARNVDFNIASFGGDDITSSRFRISGNYMESDYRIQNPYSSHISRTFITCYNTIKGANIAIESEPHLIGNKENINRYLGEMYFLR